MAELIPMDDTGLVWISASALLGFDDHRGREECQNSIPQLSWFSRVWLLWQLAARRPDCVHPPLGRNGLTCGHPLMAGPAHRDAIIRIGSGCPCAPCSPPR